MELGRFSEILDAYGARADRWPASERDSAIAFARSSLPAARALAAARALDSALDLMTVPDLELDAARFISLHNVIVAGARARPANWFGRWLGIDLTPSQLWPSLAGLTMATLLGFAVGFGGLVQLDSDHESDDISLLSSVDLPAAAP